MLRVFKRIVQRLKGNDSQAVFNSDFLAVKSEAQNLSFSQCGEDVICKHLFLALGVSKVNYLDLGAFHPMKISNTFLFYQSGGSGVTVEPNPNNHLLFKRFRAKDVNLCVGVGVQKGEFPYFEFEAPTLNTFSEEEALSYEKQGYPILNKRELPIMPINDILKEHFTERPLDLVSIDVEGLDFELLNAMDLEQFKAKVICVEAVKFSRDGRGEKDHKIKKLLEKRDYLLYADTGINYIFVRREYWEV